MVVAAELSVAVTRRRRFDIFMAAHVLKRHTPPTNSRKIWEDAATITVDFDFVKCRSARESQIAN